MTALSFAVSFITAEHKVLRLQDHDAPAKHRSLSHHDAPEGPVARSNFPFNFVCASVRRDFSAARSADQELWSDVYRSYAVLQAITHASMLREHIVVITTLLCFFAEFPIHATQ